MSHLKILMLEDSESDAGLIHHALKMANVNFEYRLVDTRDEFVRELESFLPDVIFSDHSLPQFNSLDAFEIFKSKNLNIPFILITGTVSEEFAVKCLKEGIDDYILKDNLTRLPAALTSALHKRQLESQKQQWEAEQVNFIEKLKLQNNELIKLNEELDRFVYSASHELKAPLASILGLVYLIKSELNDGNYESIAQYLQLIEESVDKLIRTIEEIIYYAINNHSEIRREKIDIQSLIDDTWSDLKYSMNTSKISHSVSINKNVEWYSDKNRLMVIFENLLSNAVKFSDTHKKQSYVNIDITILKDKVKIRLRDNGIGIEGNFIDHIFEMFYRGSSKYDGTGLGLFLVKETVAKLGGTIEVESIRNKETTFTIEIPNYENGDTND